MAQSTQRKKSPRQSKEVRVSAILKAARTVFEEQGYEKAKMAEIAEMVDVVEGTVFHYFGSKRVLVLKVMEHFYQEITEDLREAIKGIQGTRNRLHYVIWHHLNVLNNNAALCGVILRESRGLDKEFIQDIHALNRNYTDSLIQVIKEGIAAGEINKDVSFSLVRNTVYGGAEHFLWDLLADGKAIRVETAAEQLTDLVFHGISTKAADLDKSEVVSLVGKLNKLLDN